jgi:hypothetical protein
VFGLRSERRSRRHRIAIASLARTGQPAALIEFDDHRLFVEFFRHGTPPGGRGYDDLSPHPRLRGGRRERVPRPARSNATAASTVSRSRRPRVAIRESHLLPSWDFRMTLR